MKKIGLLTDFNGNKVSLNFAYFNFAQIFGAVTLVHPWEQKVHDVDLLILPGGQDVHPLRYGQNKIPWQCQDQNDNFEYFDTEVLPGYIDRKTPIFGICRGLQTLNVLLGGSLFQHVDEPYCIESRGQLIHSVVDPRSSKVFQVNSLHHQAVDKLAPGFEVVLQGFKRKKHNHFEPMSVEAIKHKTLPILATQFHPEELNHDKASEAWNWTIKEVNSLFAVQKPLQFEFKPKPEAAIF